MLVIYFSPSVLFYMFLPPKFGIELNIIIL